MDSEPEFESMPSSDEDIWEVPQLDAKRAKADTLAEPPLQPQSESIEFTLQPTNEKEASTTTSNGSNELTRSMAQLQKELREEMHRLHFVSLISRCHLENKRCRSEQLQAQLLSLLPASFLHTPYADMSTATQLLKWLRKTIQIAPDTKQGPEDSATILISSDDNESHPSTSASTNFSSHIDRFEANLTTALRRQQAPASIINMIFVTLLRGLGYKARFVRVLEVLSRKIPTSERIISRQTSSRRSSAAASRRSSISAATSVSAPASAGRPSSETNPRLVDGQQTPSTINQHYTSMPAASLETASHQKPARRRKWKTSSATSNRKVIQPVNTWVEVQLELSHSWTCLCAVNGVIGEPRKVERYATQPIAYVVAWDQHGCVVDVTARYASRWLHATQKLRTDSAWIASSLAPFQSKDGRQQQARLLEEAVLRKSSVEAALPKHFGAYKQHPLYAMERHLNQNQVLYPKEKILGYCRGEPVYARAEVHTLKSKEQWYKLAMVVKADQTPAKLVKSRSKSEGGPSHTPLFGSWQVEAYQAPIASGGVVPTNEHGTVDLFQPSMLPIGTVHIQGCPGIGKLAKTLGFHYAEPVVDFQFTGGRMIPVKDGIVVCAEHADILRQAWVEAQSHAIETEGHERTLRASSNWAKLVSRAIIFLSLQPSTACSSSTKPNNPATSGSAWQLPPKTGIAKQKP
eukprot:TRINITY_DN10873_c0_g1_i3.p1 TRINITY_DN10873_c0_g1~~TRINITY_DN10873_c0_g1_i3.p1  ORF type:complete len:691 (+),score=89.87 TRINITY_DN10873_c0_g1_i3:965-3037(+)